MGVSGVVGVKGGLFIAHFHTFSEGSSSFVLAGVRCVGLGFQLQTSAVSTGVPLLPSLVQAVALGSLQLRPVCFLFFVHYLLRIFVFSS